MARLLVLAHARTAGDPVFGDPGRLADGAEVAPVSGRVQRWVAGPEPACRETVELLGGDPVIMPGLAAPDGGRWSGRTPAAVAADDPAGLQAWLTDPTAAPPGGESLQQAQARLGRAMDGQTWPESRSVLVVSPAAARLLALHAIGGAPELSFRLDVRFGGRFELSGGGGRSWRLVVG